MRHVSPNTSKAMSDHWTGRAHRFNGAASHLRHEAEWKRVFSAAILTPKGRVVDLGCGTGACALLLAELGHVVTAIDGSQGMLDFARSDAEKRDLDIAFIQATIDDHVFSDEIADVVTIRNVLWTLEKPENALRLAYRILRPGGTLLVSDGLWFVHRKNDSAEQFGARLPFYNGLLEADARDMLAEAGFGSIESWQHLFKGHPYGAVYDSPEQLIEFFVLTAAKAA